MVNKGMGSPTDIRKKLSYDHELIATCYHEAGHAVSALYHLMHVSAVGTDIVVDKRTQKDLGYTSFDSSLEYETVANEELLYTFVISEIYINYAGLAAEKSFYKDICGTDKLPMVLKRGSGSDSEHVATLIKKFNLAPPGKKRYAFKKKAFNKARQSLMLYWDDVKLIAHALFKTKKLYWDDLKSLLTRKSKNKVFWKKQIKDIELVFEAAKINDQKFIHSVYKKTNI